MVIAAGMLFQLPAAAASDYQALLEAGKKAYSKQNYSEAVAHLKAAVEVAAAQEGQPGLLDILRLLSDVHRDSGDLAQAELVLEQAAEHCGAAEPASLLLAAILEQMAAVQRAQSHAEEALATFGRAIEIRQRRPESPRVDLARDLTAVALLLAGTDPAKSTERLEQAVREWDLASPGDPQALPAIEALATAYRDQARYEEAEPLLLRALRLREAVSGPQSPDVISTVDSLAYVEFGLKKLPEAELQYHRLLLLWETNAGPDHPMTALTLDKMAVFYAYQERYVEAENAAAAALEARTKMHLASLNQTGRVLLMQARLADAEDHYRRTMQIGDLARAPEDVLDPILRIYAKILVSLNRDGEAKSLENRIKNAVYRRSEREGLRPSPVKPPR
jgi:tetratricopeptide (TPR) repeat protein